ncbi:MAG TPA: RNA polymerase sigma factor [Tepidisphaeraceae bacterium]|nr:RNA polymerase sigma factor [Tepidisphaeraceae bacterium]
MISDADLIRCELLVLRCQRRDTRAAAELVTLFEKPLLYYLRRLVGSEADAWDLLQETWMSVFRSLPHLRDTRALPAFLYRTARNHALAQLRKRDADLRLYAAVDTPQPTTDPEPTFTPDDAAAVHAALDTLSLPHREALTLFFLEDLSIEEIASVLEIPPGTVKSRLYHAKKALGAVLRTGASHVA